MSTIKVTPEQLLHVSKQIEQGRQQLESIRNDLTARIGFIESQWSGATQERFFYDFQQSRPVLDRALEIMVNSSQSLSTIAERFQQADQEQVSLGAIAGQVATNVNINQGTGNPEEQRRMVWNSLFGAYMPASEAEDGMPGQKEFIEYWENGGSYEEMKGGSKKPESIGGDFYDEQSNAFKAGYHPTTGEPVPAWQAGISIAGLQFSKIALAFTGLYNRGYKVPSGGLRFSKSKVQKSEIKQMQASSSKANSVGEGSSVSGTYASEKTVLSDKAEALKAKGQYSQALDVHYEDMIRKKTGGKEVIYGEKGKERELDSVTSEAVIEAKRSMSAINKPDNFLNKKMKKQLQATMLYAEENGLRVEYWFKYGVHPKIQKYLENKGVIVKTGMGD
ncbi:WXG100 family type VII secretion target [Paenibacillus xylanexedens]|uniref:WXG100 family type VII secretion target n=1 Tax=Paenibacillus xylanexedens TaxID=528191 RepID=UPI001642AEB7|nr:WXG100 family type VII secretion target [Paenibacillus xylanexedens]